MIRITQWGLIGLMLFFIVQPQHAFASSSVTNATLTSSSSLTGATVSYSYTFTATSGLPAGNTITVTYPDGFNVTAATKSQYNSDFTIKSISGQTITYDVLTPTNAGNPVYYWYLQTDGIINPVAQGDYSLLLSTSSDPTPVTLPVTISSTGAAVSNASLTTSSLLAGVTAGYSYTFTATSGLPAGSTIAVTYPAGFNVAGATKSQYNSDFAIKSITGQTITYDVFMPTNVGNPVYYWYLQTDGIVNPSAPGTYLLQASTSSDPIPVMMPVAVSATGAVVSNAAITSSSLMVGATASYSLNFTATSGLPSGDTITITYPDGFNVAAATKSQYNSNFAIKSISGQTITYDVLTPTNAGNPVYYWYLQADGIVNPLSAGAYMLQLSTSSDPTPVMIPVSIIATSNVVTGASLTTSSLLASSTASYSYSFAATSGLPTGGTITVTYPAGFKVTGATKSQYNSNFAIKSISGQTITYDALTPTNVGNPVYYWYLQTDGIVNPSIPGTYLLQISTSSDPTPVMIPVAISMTGAVVSNASTTTSSLLAGSTASYSYTFTATSGLPTGGIITVTYPVGFNVAAATKNQYNSDFAIKSITGQTITYDVLIPTNAGSPVYYWYLQTDGIVNPTTPGTYLLQISTSSDPTPVLMPVTISQPVFYTLTLVINGTGGGDVNGDMSCTKGETCPSKSFAANTMVVLMPTSDINSEFAGWSSECGVNYTTCFAYMDGPKTVTATFNTIDKVRIWGKPYTTLAAAFAESTFGQIHARSTDFVEDITLVQPADLLGGMDKSFNKVPDSFTVLKGTLTIKNGGSLKVDGLVIRPAVP